MPFGPGHGVGPVRVGGLYAPLLPEAPTQPPTGGLNLQYSGHSYAIAAGSFGKVFTPFPGVLAGAPQLVPAFITVALQSPEQPLALVFRQPPASFVPLTFQPGPVVQNTLQSPEQAPSWIQGQTPPTTQSPVVGQFYAAPQLVDLTQQGTFIRVDLDALTPPPLRNTWFASPQIADLTVQPQIIVVKIAEALQVPSLRNTWCAGPQLIDLTLPAKISTVSAAQIALLLKVPNRPATFQAAPQQVDVSLFPSRTFSQQPASQTPVIPTGLHDYNLGLSLMTLGGLRL